MPTTKPEAPMACSLEDKEGFRERLQEISVRCKEIYEETTRMSEKGWKRGDVAGPAARLRRDKVRLKLVLTHRFDEETGRPRFPPRNMRLSDELVYLAIKHMKSALRGQRYPYDFDQKGDIDPNRVPSGPPPIIWAHGLPFFPIFKGYYILCGGEHALCTGWLLRLQTRKGMQGQPHLSIGPVIAPQTAVEIDHLIDRQMNTHQPCGIERDLRYKGKATARDVVTKKHDMCTLLPRLEGELKILPLCLVPGYNARCGPRIPGMCPDLMKIDFFEKNGFDYLDYNYLRREYENSFVEVEEEMEDATDSESETSSSADSDNELFVADSDMTGVEIIPEAQEQDLSAIAGSRNEHIVQTDASIIPGIQSFDLISGADVQHAMMVDIENTRSTEKDIDIIQNDIIDIIRNIDASIVKTHSGNQSSPKISEHFGSNPQQENEGINNTLLVQSIKPENIIEMIDTAKYAPLDPMLRHRLRVEGGHYQANGLPFDELDSDSDSDANFDAYLNSLDQEALDSRSVGYPSPQDVSTHEEQIKPGPEIKNETLQNADEEKVKREIKDDEAHDYEFYDCEAHHCELIDDTDSEQPKKPL